MKVSGLPVKVFAKPGSLAQPRLALTARLEDRAVLFAVGRQTIETLREHVAECVELQIKRGATINGTQ